MRAEVQSLLKYNRETVDLIRGRVASAAASGLADLVSTATDEVRADDASVLRSDTGEGRFLAGTLLGGRYRIISLLGRGGMGEVYRATDLTLKQPVALKFLPEKMAHDPLAAAHDTGVIHRDLKPANIMIDRRGEVLITDFGLAASPRELARAEARSGTPAYMAPEQLQGQRVSARSDVYSLGLVLYELFSGRRPFTTRGGPRTDHRASAA